ncbi:MAG: cation transporter, partial [Paracoccaceae bacterium]
ILVAAKFGAWLVTDSISLLSTMVDSLLDAGASLINLLAVRRALEPADREHRFGHGKAEPLAGLSQAAFISGSALFLLIWSLVFDPVPNLGMKQWLALLPLALVGIALQSGAEELVFRSYLLQQLAARFRSPLIWMIAPGLIFALFHYDPRSMGQNTWLVIAAAGVFALVASDLTRLTGSIGAAWGFHFANNVVAIAIIAIDGTIPGLALYLTPYSADDTALLPMLISGDIALMLLAWLILRRTLPR